MNSEKVVCEECRHIGLMLDCKHPKLIIWESRYTWHHKIKGPFYQKAYEINKDNDCRYFEKNISIFRHIRAFFTSTEGD